MLSVLRCYIIYVVKQRTLYTPKAIHSYIYPITFYKPRKSRLKYICNLLNPYYIGSPVRYGKQLYKHILKSSSLLFLIPFRIKKHLQNVHTLCNYKIWGTGMAYTLLYYTTFVFITSERMYVYLV